MPDGSTLIERPEHSPLGGSGAERWIECSGSYVLVEEMGSGSSEAPDYQKDGVEAHALAAHCLQTPAEIWEALEHFPNSDNETCGAVQVYLTYCQSRPGSRAYTEYAVAHPKFHPLMYSRLDRVVHDPEPGVALELMDYKHGAGVTVEVEHNAQERYYAFDYIFGDNWPEDLPRLQDMDWVKLTIVQPRGFHPDGPIRSVMIRVGELYSWAHSTLLPAMEKAAAGTREFKMGEWCRFCPAKIVCPKMRNLGADAALVVDEMQAGDMAPGDRFDIATTDDGWLAQWYGRLSQLRMFIKVISDETERRVKSGHTIDTAKLVYAKVDRAWKPQATAPSLDPVLDIEIGPAPILATFGDEAWEPRELRSPAQIEKLGPAGKAFVAEYSEMPVRGFTVAPLSDNRTAQKFTTNEEVFKDLVKPG